MSLAVFDFDGTLIDGDAGVHFARHMIKKGYLDAVASGSPFSIASNLARVNWRTARLVYQHLSLHARYRSGDVDRRAMVRRAYRNFAGRDPERVREEMRRFARNHLPGKLRPDVVDRLEEHADAGDHVVVLSTGLHGLIWPMREALAPEVEVVACSLKTRDGALTGEVEGPLTGAEKATRLVAIARRRDHDLEAAHAYADHETDADMLEVVGNPVVVHPSSEMRRRARREGWEILE